VSSRWHAPCVRLHGGNAIRIVRRSISPKGFDMKTAAAALVAAAMMMLAGCNTIEGAGRDVKATGSAVEKAADKAKPF
jgi:entericidin B